jgi:hypothetical protein
MGDSLVIEINGLGGMVVVRPGDPCQEPGTTVEIAVRRRSGLIHPHTDSVQLIPMLKGYALACEIPIEGDCSIRELADSVKIPPGVEPPRTMLECLGVSNFITIGQAFSEIHPLLGGEIRGRFLIDESGQLVIGNSSARWEISGIPQESRLRVGEAAPRLRSGQRQQTCIDGVLVAGEPGRNPDDKWHLGSRGNPIHSYGASFVLDVRGSIKPPLSPARVPPDRTLGDPRGKWAQLQNFAYLAEGRIWERIAEKCSSQENPSLFWQLAVIYAAPIRSMRRKLIWSHLAVPVTGDGKEWEWVNMSLRGSGKSQ